MAKKDTLSKYKEFKKFLDGYDMSKPIVPKEVVRKKALTQQDMVAMANRLINKLV